MRTAVKSVNTSTQQLCSSIVTGTRHECPYSRGQRTTQRSHGASCIILRSETIYTQSDETEGSTLRRGGQLLILQQQGYPCLFVKAKLTSRYFSTSRPSHTHTPTSAPCCYIHIHEGATPQRRRSEIRVEPLRTNSPLERCFSWGQQKAQEPSW